MTLYQSNPTTIDAMQWTGDNFEALLEWLNGHSAIRLSDGELNLTAGVNGAQGWVPVPQGHWLVHPPEDLTDIWPVEEEYFAAKYTVTTDNFAPCNPHRCDQGDDCPCWQEGWRDQIRDNQRENHNG